MELNEESSSPHPKKPNNDTLKVNTQLLSPDQYNLQGPIHNKEQPVSAGTAEHKHEGIEKLAL